MESVGDPAERGVWIIIFGEAARNVVFVPKAPGRELGDIRRAVRVEASAERRSRAFEVVRSIVCSITIVSSLTRFPFSIVSRGRVVSRAGSFLFF